MTSHDPHKIPSRAERAAEILDEALLLEEPARSDFLRDACGGDLSLQADIISLLNVQTQAVGFLEPRPDRPPRNAATSTKIDLPHQPGETIGNYQLLDVMGEGGFGVVYRALQNKPVRREVAFKVIKLGMDTRQVIARFEAERQALAMMNHPGIAKVFDAGSTQAGRPYFVMELVQGTPITDYCDAARLDTAARLRLFMQVCFALEHAHQKGIIHRDIKPSNVLITAQEKKPVPKIIDFGIAKATNAEQVERTVFTELRQIVGTPMYMSPEQAGTVAADIDTRADIYSLGVLLYELLTGTTPFDARKLRSASFDEMMRVIREEEPIRPSMRFSEMGVAGTQVAERRHTDSHKLRTLLRGDLDWIALKCLDKDRTRRYATASALAEDVQRHLNDEPVLARPPSAPYRLRKLVRRHRGAVAAGAALSLILLAATGVSLSFAWREAAARERERATFLREVEERQRADREAQESSRQAAAAQTAQRLAEKRAEETKQVAEFQANMLSGLDADAVGKGIRTQYRETLRSVLERQTIGEWPERRQRSSSEVEMEISKFDNVVGIIPVADVARRVLDEFLLASAVKTVEEGFSEQPLVQAQIRDSLAAAYRSLGLYGAAEEQCRIALAIRQRQLDPESADIAENLNALTWILYDQGQYASAETASRDALAIQVRLHGDKHVDVATASQTLAAALRRQAKYEEAEPLYRAAIAIRRELLGEKHLDVADSLNSLALLLQNKGDYTAAEPIFRESLAVRRELLGERHTILAGALNNLANLLVLRGNRAEAEGLLREALEMRRELLGSEHADVAQSLHNLGIFLNDNGEYDQAEPFFREAVMIWRKTLPEGHPDIARGVLALGLVLKAQKKFAEAEPLFRESVAIKRNTLGDEDLGIPYALNALAALLCDRGDYEQAESAFREIISVYEERLPPVHRQLGRMGLANTLIKHTVALADAQGVGRIRLAEAETLLSAADDAFSKSADAPPAPILVRRCLESLAELYELRHAAEPDQGYDAKAASYRSRLEKLNTTP